MRKCQCREHKYLHLVYNSDMKFIYKRWKHYYFEKWENKLMSPMKPIVNCLSAKLPTLKETIMLVLRIKTKTVTCFEAVKFQLSVLINSDFYKNWF